MSSRHQVLEASIDSVGTAPVGPADSQPRTDNCDGDGIPLYTTAHGVVPPRWIRRLPWLARVIIIFLYCDLLRPGDDFRQQLRKIVFTMGPLLSSVDLSVCAVNFATLEFDQWDTVAVFARMNFIFIAGGWWATYIICRATGNASGLLADIWVLGVWIGMIMVTLSFPDYPCEQPFMLNTIVAMLGWTPRLPLHVVMNLTGCFWAMYNSAMFSRGEPDGPLLALPGALMRELWVRVFFHFVSFGSILFVYGGLQLQLLESDRQTREAEANIEVAAGLARLLGEYSTERAAAMIDDAAREQSADPSLLAAFKILVSNLEQYRPHLPNWMLQSKPGSAANDADSDIDAELAASGEGVERRPSINGSTCSKSVASSRHSRSFGRDDSPPAVKVGALPPNVSTSATSAAAIVHFAVAHPDTAAPAPWRTRVAEATCAFTDRVHELAATTGAAVHSFVGDVVTLSWNAASRALQPEMKAARFLLRLRAETGDALVQVGGAAAAGSCRVQLAGSAGKPAALTLHAGWFAALHPLAEFGRDVQTFVVDDGVRSHIEFGAKTRAVAVVAVRKPDATRRTNLSATLALLSNSSLEPRRAFKPWLAHELLAEITDGDDEWMYVLNKQVQGAGGAAKESDEDATVDKRVAELATMVARGSPAECGALFEAAEKLVASCATMAAEDEQSAMWLRAAEEIRDCIVALRR